MRCSLQPRKLTAFLCFESLPRGDMENHGETRDFELPAFEILEGATSYERNIHFAA